MQIDKWLLIKHENEIKKGIVVKILGDDLEIKLEDGIIIRRKFWEVRNVPFDNAKKEQ
jgi:hypothetical protein